MRIFLKILMNILFGVGSIFIAGYTLYLYSIHSIGRFGVIAGLIFFLFSLLLQQQINN